MALWLHSNSHAESVNLDLVNFVFWPFSPPLDGCAWIKITVFFTMLKLYFCVISFHYNIFFIIFVLSPEESEEMK